jgi:hypothetical protein
MNSSQMAIEPPTFVATSATTTTAADVLAPVIEAEPTVAVAATATDAVVDLLAKAFKNLSLVMGMKKNARARFNHENAQGVLELGLIGIGSVSLDDADIGFLADMCNLIDAGFHTDEIAHAREIGNKVPFVRRLMLYKKKLADDAKKTAPTA